MLEICKGIVVPRKRYDKERKDMLKKIIKKIRLKLMIEFGGCDPSKSICTGVRFNDDESVISRIESENQNIIHKIGWEQAVRAALVDCAMADYYYLFEKDYGEAE